MNDAALVLPLGETIELLLGESQGLPDDAKAELILQTQSFISALISQTDAKFSEMPKIVKVFHTFFRLANASQSLFLMVPERAERIASIVSSFIQSHFAGELARDLSLFMISAVLSEISENNPILSTVVEFFQSPKFVPAFEESGGLFALWNLLIAPAKVSQCHAVFSALTRTIDQYACNGIRDFLPAMISSINQIVPENGVFAFQFLFDILSKSSSMQAFVEHGGLKAVNSHNHASKHPDRHVV
jgi:hypothetical protein